MCALACRSADPKPVPVAPAPPAAAREAWVDGSATAGGDGSPARPFRTVAEALASASTVHLQTGLYEGPFVLPAGTRLLGHGKVVLSVVGEGVVVTATDAALEGLWVQGGFTGIEARGQCSLRAVKLSGQRRTALEVVSGQLTGETLQLEGTVSETKGIHVQENAGLVLKASQLTGAFRRGIDSEGGLLHLDGVSFEGPVEALHVERGSATVSRLRARNGRGPAVFAASTRLVLLDTEVVGHEYGLQTREATLQVERFSAVRPQRAGVGLVQSKGSLKQLGFDEPGDFGGIQTLGGALAFEDVTVRKSKSYAVSVRDGEVSFKRLTVSFVAADVDARGQKSGGDALVLRQAKVALEDVKLADVEGAGLLAGARAQVDVQRFECARCSYGAITADEGSTVTGGTVQVSGLKAPAVVALVDSAVTLEELMVLGATEAPLWAECAQHSRIEVKKLQSTVAQPPSACVKLPR